LVASKPDIGPGFSEPEKEGTVMKVKEIMTQSAICCGSDTNVGRAVELMWVHNCGMLPVVGPDQKLVGVVTDRDICIAMGTRNRTAGDLTAGEIATRIVFTCKPDEEIHEALLTMASKHVRRLPVVDDDGMPQGVLSMDDIITHGDLNKWEGCCELSSEEIIRSLKKLYGQKLPIVHTKAAAA
jgi:CBS domain-containing protein